MQFPSIKSPSFLYGNGCSLKKIKNAMHLILSKNK
jgi:hypothetical protein